MSIGTTKAKGAYTCAPGDSLAIITFKRHPGAGLFDDIKGAALKLNVRVKVLKVYLWPEGFCAA